MNLIKLKRGIFDVAFTEKSCVEKGVNFETLHNIIDF